MSKTKILIDCDPGHDTTMRWRYCLPRGISISSVSPLCTATTRCLCAFGCGGFGEMVCRARGGTAMCSCRKMAATAGVASVRMSQSLSDETSLTTME
jgi:hypothetical protein